MLREITTNWTTLSGRPGTTVMYFQTSQPASDQRSALATFWTAISDALDAATTWEIATSGKEIDPATGTLTGTWADGTARAGDGNSTGAGPVPDATQALVQWQSGVIVNGRRVRGRTFVPGFSQDVIISGELGAGTVTGLTTAAQNFLNAMPAFNIWHRPSASGPGQAVTPNVATVWTELAVLRRRR